MINRKLRTYEWNTQIMNWIRSINSESRNLSNSSKKQRQFLLLLFVFMTLMFYRWHGLSDGFYVKSLLFTCLLGILFFASFLIYPVLYVWFMLGKIAGDIVSGILLGIVYYSFIPVFRLLIKYNSAGGWQKKESTSDYSKMG